MAMLLMMAVCIASFPPSLPTALKLPARSSPLPRWIANTSASAVLQIFDVRFVWKNSILDLHTLRT